MFTSARMSFQVVWHVEDSWLGPHKSVSGGSMMVDGPVPFATHQQLIVVLRFGL